MGCNCGKNRTSWQVTFADGRKQVYESLTLANNALRAAGTPPGAGSVKPVAAS